MGGSTADRIRELLENREWLHALVRTLHKDVNEADDVEQDTLLAALNSPKETKSIRGWLYRIALNNLRTLWRSRRRNRQATNEGEGYTTAFLDPVEQEEIEMMVTQAVLDLAEPYQATILLAFYLGRSPAQISRLHKVSLGTVYYRRTRALELLRERLEQRLSPRRFSLMLIWPTGSLPVRHHASRARSQSPVSAAASPSISRWRRSLYDTLIAALPVALLAFLLLSWTSRVFLAAPSEAAPELALAGTPDSDADEAQAGSDITSPTIASNPTPQSAGTPPQRTINVAVTDADSGVPVPRARVYTSRTPTSKTSFLPIESRLSYVTDPAKYLLGTTDREGQVEVPTQALSWQTIWIEKEGFATYREPGYHRTLGPTYTAELRPADPSYLVIVGPDSIPLGEVPLSICGSDGKVQRVFTNTRGLASFSWEAVSYAARIELAGFAPVFELLISPACKIQLEKARPSTGRLVDSAGTPISDALVQIKLARCISLFDTATDPNGVFSSPPLSSHGTATFEVSHPRFVTKRFRVMLPWADGQTFPLSHPVASRRVILVRERNGDVVSGGRLSVYYGSRLSKRVIQEIPPHGVVELPAGAEGRVALVLNHREWGFQLHEVNLETVNDVEPVEFPIDEPLVTRGRIVDLGGAPVAGCDLIFGLPLREDHVVAMLVTSGEDGAFRFPGEAFKTSPQHLGFRASRNHWTPLVRSAVARDQWILGVADPHFLHEVNGQPCDHNQVLLEPGSSVNLVVETRKPHILRWGLTTTAGLPASLPVDFIAVSTTTGSFVEKSVLRCGYPEYTRVPEAPNAYFCVAIPPRGPMCFLDASTGDWPIVAPIDPPRHETEILVRTRGGDPALGRTVFFWPADAPSRAGAPFYLGGPSDTGRVDNVFRLPVGEYEFYAGREPFAVANLKLGVPGPAEANYEYLGTWSVRSGQRVFITLHVSR